MISSWWRGMRIGSRFMWITAAGLVVIIVCSLAAISVMQSREMETQVHDLSLSEMTSLQALIVNVMAKRPEDPDNIGVQVFNNWFGSRNKNYAGKVWSVWSDKVTRHVAEVEPGRPAKTAQDDIDREALATGHMVARRLGDSYRLSMPVVLGVSEGANQEVCHTCHGAMGIKDGEVIAVLSSSLSLAEAQARLRTAILLLGLGGLVIAVVSVVAVRASLHRFIVRPMAMMTGIMARLAEGEHSIEVPDPERPDEIGDIARALGVFKSNALRADALAAEQEASRAARDAHSRRIEQLAREFDQAVTGTLDTLGTASVQLEATAQTLSANAGKTNGQAKSATGAAHEASSSIQTVASAAEELSASIAEIARQVEQSSQVSQSASEEASATNGIVQGLAESSAKIGEVVKLINDIASQTNLLALNATIEAARAGEAGKGFAVVAHEVKNLANQTARATEEISAQIATVQNASQEAVDAIGAIVGRIDEINAIAAAIAAAIEEQSAATSEIARSVHQTAAGTQQISANIAEVSAAASETGTAAGQVLSSAGSLAREAAEIKTVVSRFLQGVRSAG